jgi:hypothetical protein
VIINKEHPQFNSVSMQQVNSIQNHQSRLSSKGDLQHQQSVQSFGPKDPSAVGSAGQQGGNRQS